MTPEETEYYKTVEPYVTALRMVRDAVGEMFGPLASIESQEATLLRGPEPHHDAEAIIAALGRLRDHFHLQNQALVQAQTPPPAPAYQAKAPPPQLGRRR